MPSLTDALEQLNYHDPARSLSPLSIAEHVAVRDRIVAHNPAPAAARRSSRSERLRWRVGVGGLVTAAVIAGGGSWAAGAWNPTALFQGSPTTVLQNDPAVAMGGYTGDSPGAKIWQNQTLIPSSVIKAATVDIPSVGSVAFWYGETKQSTWCSGLQLPDGSWVGEGVSPLDAGGDIPGCQPTRAQENAIDPAHPTYELTGFDYSEGDVVDPDDVHSLWRIYYGQVDVRGAVRVTETVSGVSVPVTHGNLFELAILDNDPGDVHGEPAQDWVAYDAAGTVIAEQTIPAIPPVPGAKPFDSATDVSHLGSSPTVTTGDQSTVTGSGG